MNEHFCCAENPILFIRTDIAGICFQHFCMLSSCSNEVAIVVETSTRVRSNHSWSKRHRAHQQGTETVRAMVHRQILHLRQKRHVSCIFQRSSCGFLELFANRLPINWWYQSHFFKLECVGFESTERTYLNQFRKEFRVNGNTLLDDTSFASKQKTKKIFVWMTNYAKEMRNEITFVVQQCWKCPCILSIQFRGVWLIYLCIRPTKFSLGGLLLLRELHGRIWYWANNHEVCHQNRMNSIKWILRMTSLVWMVLRSQPVHQIRLKEIEIEIEIESKMKLALLLCCFVVISARYWCELQSNTKKTVSISILMKQMKL